MHGQTLPCRRCARLSRALMAANLSRVEAMRDRDDLETYLEVLGMVETYVVWRDMRRSSLAKKETR